MDQRFNLKIKSTPYVHFRSIKCGCEGCRQPAVAQFYICALESWMAICKEHDLQINHSALRVVMSKEKADLCLHTYHRRAYSLPTTLSSNADSKPQSAEDAAKLPLLTFV